MGLKREHTRSRNLHATTLLTVAFVAYESFAEWNPDPEIHVSLFNPLLIVNYVSCKMFPERCRDAVREHRQP